MHTLVIENIPRSGLQFERVDGINRRMTRLPNNVGGTYKELSKFVKKKKKGLHSFHSLLKRFIWNSFSSMLIITFSKLSKRSDNCIKPFDYTNKVASASAPFLGLQHF